MRHDDESGSMLRKRVETTVEGGENNIEAQNWNDEGDEMGRPKDDGESVAICRLRVSSLVI